MSYIQILKGLRLKNRDKGTKKSRNLRAESLVIMYKPVNNYSVRMSFSPSHLFSNETYSRQDVCVGSAQPDFFAGGCDPTRRRAPERDAGACTPGNFWKLGCLRMRSVRFEGSVMWKRVTKSKLKNVGFTQTGEFQTDGLFWRGGYSMDVFYGYRERHYLKEKEVKSKIRRWIVLWVCCGKPWWSAVLIIMILQ